MGPAGHFRLSSPSWTYRQTWPGSHAGIDPMPDKMNLDYLKLLYGEFQKYEVMIMSVIGGQLPKKNTQTRVIKQQNTSKALELLVSQRSIR